MAVIGRLELSHKCFKLGKVRLYLSRTRRLGCPGSHSGEYHGAEREHHERWAQEKQPGNQDSQGTNYFFSPTNFTFSPTLYLFSPSGVSFSLGWGPSIGLAVRENQSKNMPLKRIDLAKALDYTLF